MRCHGVPERFITGDASDWEKFQQWAETVPFTIRNPLFDWTHMELQRIFGIGDRLLCPETCRAIWEECNAKLATPEFSCRSVLRRLNVRVVCTTDDPADSLEAHRRIAADAGAFTRVYPTWRPDAGMAVEAPAAFNVWLDRLAAAANVEIRDFDSYLDALRLRHDYFHSVGCRVSDLALRLPYAAEFTPAEIRVIFQKARAGGNLDADEVAQFKSEMIYEFGVMDAEKGWAQQLHLGALRNNSTRLMRSLGPDSGGDSMGDWEIAQPLARQLDRLDAEGRLPKTIIYTANPSSTEVVATMLGCFQDSSLPGKIQLGAAWWFLDQADGIRRQLEATGNLVLLRHTLCLPCDGRSFLSFVRHDYFRRVLCDWLGADVERGRIPNDPDLIGGMAQDICLRNSERYFGFAL